MAALLLPAVCGGAVFAVVWFSVGDRQVRLAFLAAVLGSVFLVYEALFLSVCGLGENRSALYVSRCEGVAPPLPLIGVPVLLLSAGALARWRNRARALCLLGAASFLVASVVPWMLLAEA